MRYFGVQIGFTIMVALLYRKLGRDFSFAHWLISNGNLHVYFASLVSILEQRGDQKNTTKKSNIPSKESICTDLNFTVEKIREVKLTCKIRGNCSTSNNALKIAHMTTTRYYWTY